MVKNVKITTTKAGVASLYVVIFATILFGVITLSFIRIILSEATQSNNDGLSQSAYDSALAGVEDAKIAVNKYYQCVNNPAGADCNRYLAANALFDDANPDCDNFKLKRLLYPESTDTEVKIQESTSNNSDQAYTCVILKNKVPDYRSTLSSDTRTRVVPIGIGSQSLSDVREIEFRWYSEVNGTEFANLDHNNKFANKTNATTPPTVSLTLLKTGPTIDLNAYNNSVNVNYSTMILLPSEQDGATNTITQAQINSAGNSDQTNSPFTIKCEHTEFACTVRLTDLNFATGGNAMLVVALPYGDTITDFAVTLKNSQGDTISFENVQISVDVTGRANQLLRRVETRLDPSDAFFPYPQYELELTGTDSQSLWKNFWITANCWTENGRCPNNGTL